MSSDMDMATPTRVAPATVKTIVEHVHLGQTESAAKLGKLFTEFVKAGEALTEVASSFAEVYEDITDESGQA